MNKKSTPSVGYLIWTGIALIVLGVLAIAAPAFAGAAVMMVIGTILLVSGIFQLIRALREDSLSSKLFGIVLGVITAICGATVLARPLLGLSMFTLVLAIFFVIEGIWKIVVSFSFRPASGWIAMLTSGILGFLLGFLIWKQWPLSGAWAVGVLLGVDLLMTGLSMVIVAITIKQLAKEVAETAAQD